MATCYAKVLQSAPLNADSQGGTDNPMGALWVLLSALNTFDTNADVLANPASDVLRRLDSWKQNRWMREFAIPFLTSLELKLAQQ